ncbi:MAG: hypothetical protein ABIS35_14725 [Terracoccus sp.]
MTPITRNPSPTLRPTRKALRLDMARRAASTRAPLPHPHRDTDVRRRATAFTPMTPISDPTP